MSVESDIWSALKTRAALLAVAPISLVPANLISWPNVTFTTPGPTLSWLRVTFIPNRNRRLFLGSNEPHERKGLLQIDCFTPKSGGSNAPLAMAATVASHFPCDLQLNAGSGSVRIEKAPDVMQSIPDETHLLTPVAITYQAFA